MCGIVGYFGPGPQEGRLEQSCRLLAHRGPDQQNWVLGPGYGFGHALLSILGTRPVAQPLAASQGNGLLTYNGEIYNYLELVEGEGALGARFLARSDTEVLVEGLALHGTDFLPRLNGIFALGWMDHRTGLGLLARDALGVKPLYYAQVGETLYFASETRALRYLADLPAELEPEGLYSAVRFRYPLGGRSLYRGIQMLPPGCFLVFEGGRARLGRHAPLDRVGPAPAAEAEAEDQVSALLNQAVRLQTRSDRDFCTFLSGGLDSSLLSAMAKGYVRQLDTYSVGFEDPAQDESGFALEVASHIGSRHHGYRLDEEAFREAHGRLVGHLEEPVGVPNQVALAWLCRHLGREHRCVLSGEGADEVFGGYGRIFLLGLDWERLHGRLEVAPGGLETLRTHWPAPPATFAEFFHDRYAYVPEAEARLLLRPFLDETAFRQADQALRADFQELFRDLGPEPGCLMRAFQRLHLPGLLLRLDVATMANGVEGRVPFLDTGLVSLLNALPWTWKMRPEPRFWTSLAAGVPAGTLSEVEIEPKAMLKRLSLAHLPRSIVHRPKMGFPIPGAFYARTSLPPGITSPYGAWVHANLRLWAEPGSRSWKS